MWNPMSRSQLEPHQLRTLRQRVQCQSGLQRWYMHCRVLAGLVELLRRVCRSVLGSFSLRWMRHRVRWRQCVHSGGLRLPPGSRRMRRKMRRPDERPVELRRLQHGLHQRPPLRSRNVHLAVHGGQERMRKLVRSVGNRSAALWPMHGGLSSRCVLCLGHLPMRGRTNPLFRRVRIAGNGPVSLRRMLDRLQAGRSVQQR
jgi:hypothetical protein